jgi:hypothetical protein
LLPKDPKQLKHNKLLHHVLLHQVDKQKHHHEFDNWECARLRLQRRSLRKIPKIPEIAAAQKLNRKSESVNSGFAKKPPKRNWRDFTSSKIRSESTRFKSSPRIRRIPRALWVEAMWGSMATWLGVKFGEQSRKPPGWGDWVWCE